MQRGLGESDVFIEPEASEKRYREDDAEGSNMRRHAQFVAA